MPLVTNKQVVALWQEVICEAQQQCSIQLNPQLETYLVSLLMRYSNQPELAVRIFATSFLEAQQSRQQKRMASLQIVGDECLIYAGLFPQAAEKRHVKVSYFVDLGRSAYSAVSQTANDLYWSLAIQFVSLMDVLQAIRPSSDLLPLTAFEQWEELGSQRAFKILEQYTNGIPIKKLKS